MSCRENCPHNTRARRIPRERLDQARRKLEFSESPPAPQPVNKYENFKKVSETHSSHIIEPPMYTSSQMAMVPESFLEMFNTKPQPADAAAAAAPVQRKTPSPEIPQSFLKFLEERAANVPSPSRSPYQSSPTSPAPCYVPGPTPYNTSYYGYDIPGAPRGIIFDPKITSTPKAASPKYPPSAAHPGYYYPPPFTGCYSSSKSYRMGAGYGYPPAQTAGAVGIGRYAYAASNSPPTPPTPPSACQGPCAKGTSGDSTVSSGDFLGSSSRGRSVSRRSTGTGMDEPSQGRSIGQSPPPGKYVMTSIKKRISTSSISGGRTRQSDTVCTDDLLQSGSHSPARCPILGVTPVQSCASLSASNPGIASPENRQNISKSIENELMAREAQERSQLESDLMRWQQARRRLVMNTANMGA